VNELFFLPIKNRGAVICPSLKLFNPPLLTRFLFICLEAVAIALLPVLKQTPCQPKAAQKTPVLQREMNRPLRAASKMRVKFLLLA